MVVRVKLPYLWVQDVKGRPYAYYRRDGQRIRIPGEMGSPAFLAEYQRVHATFDRPDRERPAAGTFAALVIEYRSSPDFTGLADRSRRDYGRILDRLAERYGKLPVATMPRALVFKLRDEMAATPRMANYTIAVLRRLLSFAVDHGYRPDNPALRPRLLRTDGGHRPWTDGHLEKLMAQSGLV